MLRISFVVLIIGISTINALFFGGGGGGGCCCQQSCAPSCGGGCQQSQSQQYLPPPPQYQPPPPQSSYAAPPQYQPPPPQSSYAAPPQYQPPPPPPQNSYAAPPPPPSYVPPQNSYASPPQQQYAPPVSFPSGCQPRYIIVRPVEQVSHPESPIASPSNYQTPVEPAASPLIPSEPQASGSYKTGAPYKSVRASKTVLVDARCNSAELRQLLEENIVAEDANESKRRVHKAANEQFTTSEENSPQGIDVICAPGAFSYRIATDFFCEHAKANITCFAYQQHIN